ncbi:hypothetical protein J7M23_11830 [Candidatus Sumerlaeota bacterium]|nr:hypothetical protein [Candidatus Sumerlaeota bacterium]
MTGLEVDKVNVTVKSVIVPESGAQPQSAFEGTQE